MLTRHAGLFLFIGVILTVVATMFRPGVFLINPVDQTDFSAAIGAIGKTPVLSHLTLLLHAFGLLMVSFGVVTLFPLALRQGGLVGAFLGFGVFVTVFRWLGIVLGLGMVHFVTYTTQSMAAAPDGSALQASLQATALSVHTNASAFFVLYVTLFPFASFFLGVGLASRFQDLSAYKIASYVLSLAGLIALINFIIVMFLGVDHGVTLLRVNNYLMLVAMICVAVIGVGMYRGRSELAGEGSSD